MAHVASSELYNIIFGKWTGWTVQPDPSGHASEGDPTDNYYTITLFPKNN